MMTTSILLAGVGGQGIVLASTIVAAAAMKSGHCVKANEVHGMAQRGGSVVAEVRYGSEVNSPLIIPGTAIAIAAFEQLEALRYAHYLRKDGIAIVSSQKIVPATATFGQTPYPENVEERLRSIFSKLVYFDAEKIAGDVGNSKASNVVVLGALSNVLDFPEQSWLEAISESVNPKHVEVNLQAFKKGRSVNK